jgi:hypothetical protein
MTDIERKAREYATDRGYGRGTKDWHAAVEDFLAGSKEGQREAFEALGKAIQLLRNDYPKASTDAGYWPHLRPQLEALEAIHADYLSRKEE